MLVMLVMLGQLVLLNSECMQTPSEEPLVQPTTDFRSIFAAYELPVNLQLRVRRIELAGSGVGHPNKGECQEEK
ncbi:hypothetical protein DFH06DRAFT_1191038 [Mycena polygramma]|nr:hypothetical protein DFH06DRAFT_1191038 [Mycena polygramma]